MPLDLRRRLSTPDDIPTPGQAAAAALAAAAVVAAVDVVDVAVHSGGDLGPAMAAGVLAVSFGCAAPVAVTLELLRRQGRVLAARSLIRRALYGALQGAALAAIVFGAEFLPRFTVEGKVARGAALALAMGFGAFAMPALGRLRPVAAAALVAVGMGYQEMFSWRERYFLHLGLDLVAIAGGARLLAPLFERAGKRSAVACAVVAVGFAVGAHPFLERAPDLRRVFHGASVHGKALSLPLEVAADFDRDGASPLFGGFDCDPMDPARVPGAAEIPGDGVDQNCEGGDGEPREAAAVSRSAGAAAGADVVLISVEAMRWDESHRLAKTYGALGPHVEFSRAVAPSSRTTHSIGSVLRGRAMREVPFDPAMNFDGVEAGGPPTLGEILGRAGWRPFYVPTHVFFAERRHLAAGFEARMPRGVEAAFSLNGGDWPVVPARAVLETALDVARETKGRLALWFQVMESHDPYRWNGGQGPPSLEGYAHALSDLDGALAGFLDALAAVRGGRPRIVAVFGDHGEEFGEHGYRYHASTVYAEQVRVGFRLAWPGAPRARIDAPISTSAIPATVVDLLGLGAEASFTAPSALPCIDGLACPEVVVSETHRRKRPGYRAQVGYTTATHRLVVDPVHRTEQLFDTSADPREQRDIAATSRRDLEAARRAARKWGESH